MHRRLGDARTHGSPAGVRAGASVPASPSNAALASVFPMPAQRANDVAVDGPKTCKYRRASSRRASRASMSCGGPDQTTGWRGPSQRMRAVPVGAA